MDNKKEIKSLRYSKDSPMNKTEFATYIGQDLSSTLPYVFLAKRKKKNKKLNESYITPLTKQISTLATLRQKPTPSKNEFNNPLKAGIIKTTRLPKKVSDASILRRKQTMEPLDQSMKTMKNNIKHYDKKSKINLLVASVLEGALSQNTAAKTSAANTKPKIDQHKPAKVIPRSQLFNKPGSYSGQPSTVVMPAKPVTWTSKKI